MMLTSPQRDWIPLLLLSLLSFGQIRYQIDQDNTHCSSGPSYEHSALQIRRAQTHFFFLKKKQKTILGVNLFSAFIYSTDTFLEERKMLSVFKLRT